MKRLLFVHPNFPGQFLHLASHLARRTDLQIVAVGQLENLKSQAVKIPGIRLAGYRVPERPAHAPHFGWLQSTEDNIRRAQATLRLCLALKKDGFVPDTIIAHVGWGDTLFIREAFPDARILGYFEFFFRPSGADIGFDPEFPHSLENRLEVRIKNTTHLLAWEDTDVPWSPTRWQASLFPAELRPRLRVQHEGVDTGKVRPAPSTKACLPGGEILQTGDEILTLVNRNMEPHRGFHIFMRALPAIQKRRPRAITLIVGSDENYSYGNRSPSGESWKTALLREVGSQLDLSRIHFLGSLSYDAYLRVLQISRAHVYLSYPYFASWSLLEAMACGCLVIGSDTPPVSEFIREGSTGMLFNFFDTDALAERVCEALANPDRFVTLRQNAREHIQSHYDLHQICLPQFTEMIGIP